MSRVVVFEPRVTVVDLAAHTLDLQRLATAVDNFEEFHGLLVPAANLVRTSTQILLVQAVVPVNCQLGGQAGISLTGRFFYFEGPVSLTLSTNLTAGVPITVICG